MAILEDSKIQFRSVVAIVGGMLVLTISFIGGTWKLALVMNTMTTQIINLHDDLENVKSNSYTLSRASEQALRTALENPSLRVPDPRDPNKLIVVYSAATGH